MRLKLKNFLNTIESFIRTDATVARVYQFPDRNITIAGTDDVATVQGTADAAQTDATQAISDAAAAQGDINTHAADTSNPHSVTAAQVGAVLLINTAVVLTSAASIDITSTKHTLATALSAITFTISYTGDDITIEIALSSTDSVFTFPVTALCVSDGISSGDNLCTVEGVSGDKYIIAIKKIGSAYYVVSKNFGQ